MNSEPVYPHFSTSVWLPNGQRVYFTIPIDRYETAYEAALEFTNMLLSKGALTREPGLEAGEQREIITTVMRREKPSDSTPIIDFYTAWGEGGDEPWGTFKYMHMYLGTEESVNAFLSVSGLKSLEQIPLYDAQAPLKRTHGKRHAKEIDVRTPFYIVKRQGAEKMGSDGKPFKPWEFVRFETVAGTPPSTPPQATKDAPATTKASSQAKAAKTPQTGDKRAFDIARVETVLTKDGKPYYNLIATDNTIVSTFSRDIFRVWGYTDDVTAIWQKAGHKYDIEIPMPIEAKLVERKDGKGTAWAAIIPEVEF